MLLIVVMIAGALTLCGCGGKTTSTPDTSGTTGETDSGTKTETAEEHPADVQVIYDFFDAINRGDYVAAYALRTMSREPGADYQQFVDSYQPYVDTVKVVSVKKLPEFSTAEREEFQVEFDATYIKQYPAGSGYLPTFYVVVPDTQNEGKWLIESEGTGP
ncbi:MAG: hypothetical protein V1748_07820 [Actinomycetota bacterium]